MAPKKKLSKKELDKKKKEEEDRRLQEEEEARLKAEQEEKERIRQEKIEAEERKKVEKQELKKRSIELDEYRVFKFAHEDKLSEDDKNRRYKYSWERYLRCDGSPDPTISQEINTFINLWREDNVNVTIDPIMIDGRMCLTLIEELEFLIEDYKNDTNLAVDIPKYEKTIKKLQIVLQEKIDRASAEMLSRASFMTENEMSNLEKFWKFEKMTLCLWANLTKNLRVTKFEFADLGMTISLPKSLMLSDIAFRILFTRYDHWSSDCKYYHPQKKIVEKTETTDLVVEVKTEIVEIKEEENEKTSMGSHEPDVMDDLNKIDDENEEVEKEETVQELEEEIDPPPEDLIPVPELVEWKDFDGPENVIDLRSLMPVGGLYHINMVQLPPQPKIVNGWTMTQQVNPPKLYPFPFVVSQAEPSTLKSKQSVETIGKENQNTAKEPQSKSIIISIKMPEDVIIVEEPQLALWNPSSKEWKTDGVSLVHYKEDEKLLSFEMMEFGLFAIFQDFHANMPFQSWILRPYRQTIQEQIIKTSVRKSTYRPDDLASNFSTRKSMPNESDDQSLGRIEKEEIDFDIDSKNQCLLTINAAIFDVNLHICENRVRLLYNEEHIELNPLANKWYSVPELMQVMRAAGINIFPREDSRKYVSVTQKNALTEDMLYDQMALLSPSVAFSWSRWNAECKNTDLCILLASEHLNYERPVNEDDWSVLSFTRKKIEKLQMKEFDETFSNEVDERISFHSNFYHFYQEFGTEEGMIAVKNIDSHYFNLVRNLLKAIRPVVFS